MCCSTGHKGLGCQRGDYKDELIKRSKAYNHIRQLFGFLTQLLTMGSVELENQAKALREVYSNDLNNDLLIELKHSVPRVKLQERGSFFK